MSSTLHLSEDDLVLHHYGEEGRPDAAAHLADCGVCRGALAGLRQVLDAVERAPVPDPGPFLGARVWARLAPRLPSRSGDRGAMTVRSALRAAIHTRRWAAAASVLLLVLASFLAGVWRGRGAGDASIPEEIRQRVLQVAVADHLERSDLLLTELLNGVNGSGTGPAAAEGSAQSAARRAQAETLVAAGRIYRQTAEAAGDQGLAAMLGDLERVLLEVAHADDPTAASRLEGLQKQVESSGILFKVRVMSRQLRGPWPQPAPDRLERAGRRT
ncbi:MAG: hypothetical protein ACREAA_21775 [Candidatus Polarisedimenticolia bacterium]